MPFLKGHSGNPGGRPKEKPFRDALRVELAATGEDAKALRDIAKALIGKARDGDIQAIREIADRLDGKPAQALEHTGQDGGPIETSGVSAREIIAARLASISAANAHDRGTH